MYAYIYIYTYICIYDYAESHQLDKAAQVI